MLLISISNMSLSEQVNNNPLALSRNQSKSSLEDGKFYSGCRFSQINLKQIYSHNRINKITEKEDFVTNIKQKQQILAI